MALQRKQAPSVSTAHALHATLYSGKKEGSWQEAATLSTAPATPVLACTGQSSGCGRAGKALTHRSKVLCGGKMRCARKRAGAHQVPITATAC